jgi:hypothetical protein
LLWRPLSVVREELVVRERWLSARASWCGPSLARPLNGRREEKSETPSVERDLVSCLRLILLRWLFFKEGSRGHSIARRGFLLDWEGSRARSFLLRRGFLLGLEGARGRGSQIARGRASRRHQTNVARKNDLTFVF